MAGLKIVLDCAHGATYDVAPKVFTELGADVVVIGNKPNGLNINLDCGSTHPKQLQQAVLSEHADLGIAFDGDGDRVVMVDEKGEVIDGDELLFIIAQHRHSKGSLGGGVVGTLMTNLGMEKALERLGIEFVRAKVGDRYVMEQLNSRGWVLGGEGSGHLICKHLTTTGDGVVAALQVLRAVVASGGSLNDIKKGMSKYPQKMINVKVSDASAVIAMDELKSAVTGAESRLADRGRVLLRPSGTEPVLRVMVEGEDASLVTQECIELAAIVEKLAQ